MRSFVMMLLTMLLMADIGAFREEAELVLLGGRVWTGDPQQPHAEAVAIGRGRILAVGSAEAVRAWIGSRTHVLDVRGRLVLPGFIDNHTHFVNGGFQLLSVDLRDARDPQEFARRIAERAKALPPGRWITGGNWDHELWPGAPLPRKEWIDPHTPNTPVFVTRLDGHMGLANSLALRRAGIMRETPDPPGGTIVRDPQTGEPTGILKDAAMELVYRVIPEPSDSEYDEALRAALREAARVGVTSIQDITEWAHWPVYRRARQRGELTVRVYARTPIPEWERQREVIAREGPGDEWLRFGGFKGFVDGSLGSTTALFFEPYTDAPQTSGLLHGQMFPEGIMKQRIAAADRAGFQCSIHAIGDKANALLLDIFEEVIRENGPRDRRFRIEHAQHLRPQDIPRMARLGVIASMQPYHAIDDGRWAEKRIGRERCKTTYAFRSLLDAGVRVTFGSDWPVAPLNPLLGIYAAVTRKTLDGKNPNGWFPEQKITVEEAVRAYTVWGAYAEFAETVKGSIEVGKFADVVVLSRDIFTIPPDEIAQVEVLYTIAGGKIVYAAR
ncbi:MAG: amidohydrolase [Blastocatellia bacterium]|nr:amidohydrolase [Blastocatellia bacterium]MDW8256951.1 amidohydrolase [Acidobacteriota bacterium]